MTLTPLPPQTPPKINTIVKRIIVLSMKAYKNINSDKIIVNFYFQYEAN